MEQIVTILGVEYLNTKCVYNYLDSKFPEIFLRGKLGKSCFEINYMLTILDKGNYRKNETSIKLALSKLENGGYQIDRYNYSFFYHTKKSHVITNIDSLKIEFDNLEDALIKFEEVKKDINFLKVVEHTALVLEK